MILFLLTLAFPLTSLGKEPGDLPEPRPMRCQQAALQACIDENQRAQNAALADAAEAAKKIVFIETEISTLRESHASLTSEMRSLRISAQFSDDEVNERSSINEVSPVLFPGGPTTEAVIPAQGASAIQSDSTRNEVVRIHRELAQRFRAQASSLEASETQMLTNISALGQERAAFAERKRQAEERAKAHGIMCEHGCQTRICPGL